ncbi:MAG TPA: lysylphosphatidylglycerol synthase transmembrane domain-containing protein [Streptosporangiaceae bacterium]|nr:lysylphosphatidylglycerol synthase transmembrane domain-containing protein [Streptosporangiaceae bacterium]
MPDQPAGAPADAPAGPADAGSDSQRAGHVRGGDTGQGTSEAGGRSRAGSALSAVLRVAASRTMRWAFVAAAVGFGCYAIASDWSHVQAGLSRLGPVPFAAGFVCVLAALLAQMQVYRELLSALGSPLPRRVAAQILFIGQLGKYLPGSVWPVMAQMELGAAHRVPRARSASASVLAMLLSLVTGILVGLVMLPFGGRTSSYWWVFLFAPVILACLHPKVLNRMLDGLLRLAKRPPLERPLSGRAIAVALTWCLVAWVFFGLQIWVLAEWLGLSGGSGVLLAIGGFAFAWSAGFLVVFAPAGAGVRELVLVALLSPFIGSGNAWAVALVSRVLMTLGDLVSAGTAGWAARRWRHGSAAAPPN